MTISSFIGATNESLISSEDKDSGKEDAMTEPFSDKTEIATEPFHDAVNSEANGRGQLAEDTIDSSTR